MRRELAAPKLQALKMWMDQTLAATSTKSDLGKAILYSAKRWVALTRYVDDRRIEIDNSAAERGLRRVVLVQNNYLFAGSDTGGERAAAMYSLIGTAKGERQPQPHLRAAWPAQDGQDRQRQRVHLEDDGQAYDRGVEPDFSQPGKLTGNARVESFNGRLRQERLNAVRRVKRAT
jgi:hypothetical protein